ncbi:hypothetical protein [Sphingorhabdus wooponensis]|uniref:Uncharacterized protein n=1 Tax=Sphingorhabdus wooponensis TaxID=940136 RepID=A0A426RT28_9SPHN|nr:hypothetical protein [Sphingorhabdus wooponensis]RRQ52138.1 hypothetical protein D7D48_04510 [Sphingorhabdus wooponensis]
MSEWISSLHAVKRLRDAGLNAPEATLGLWAEAGFLRARAIWGRFSNDGGTDELTFPDESPADPDGLGAATPWPNIPSDFWHYVNVKHGNAEAHYEAGIFAALVVLDPEIGSHSDTEHIKLYGVSFNSDNLDALLNGVGEPQVEVKLTKTAPSNRGRRPNAEGWADFGAALARFVYDVDMTEQEDSGAIYEAVADMLANADRQPLDIRTVKPMIEKTILWIKNNKVEGHFGG